MHQRLGCAETSFTLVGLWQGKDGFDFGESAFFSIKGKDGHRHGHFVVYEDVFTTRMEGEMARAASCRCFGKGRVVRRKLARGGIGFVDEYFVQTKIAGEGEAIVRAEVHRMSVRSGLALRINAGAFMLDETGCYGDGTVVVNSIRGDTATTVVRNCDHLAGFIDVYMARITANGA